ncbi:MULTISPECIES: hypothetical protein [Thermococcus]|uniref:Uncharacterized protein n=1 Tax=Thermococcus sibiricus (strain DSM 12597 / MM 739) TaxID=604354 RepID=C6A564_THESM|nr:MULTISPECIES: hypothetical protein [Thermococcus]ACS90759.1 hypothetical protein TSIB_1708 [Thermococcus sibiricus MM 739]MBC7094218.1 hypothetical protein [Thermococcus sp.]
MEWKSLLIGFIIGVIIAIPYSLAHSGAPDQSERDSLWNGFGPMTGHIQGGMMVHGMMDDEMYQETEEHMASGDFAEMHEEMKKGMEPIMEKYMGEGWKEMHETCERYMGIEEEEENE